MLIAGDFNAHTGNEPVLGFTNHTHDLNNNGALLIKFCQEMHLTCLNTMRWGLQAPETPTFRRHYEHGLVESILDYELVSENFLNQVSQFQVHTNTGFELDSDHATLYFEISFNRSKHHPIMKTDHQLRRIKKWKIYKDVLEKRLASATDFKSKEVNDQEIWLKDQMKSVGLSLTTPTRSSAKHKPTVSVKQNRLQAEVRNARRNYFSSERSTQSPEENMRYKSLWMSLKQQHNTESFMNRLRLKRQARAMLRTKGPKSQKLFWSMIGGSKKRKLGIDLLEDKGNLVSNPDEKVLLVENFLIKKFKASLVAMEEQQNQANEEAILDTTRLGKPDRVLSDEDAKNIQVEILMSELEANIKDLDISKAEGADGVTNAMIKNLPQNGKEKLLEIYNNVLLSGCVPSDWRVGEIVLVLKKKPITLVENYRPITLISCISKLMTKILAKRISSAVESSRILGPEQQGFRKGRRCEDNIFIVNSLLAGTNNKKVVAHLLFLDLKEAYDRVDRPTLYSKLRQLNFPEGFVAFLQDYYSNDFVTTDSAGAKTRKIFLTRGLRQGCNLSAILFVIYMSELGNRLRRAGVGTGLSQTILLSFLKFADDILLFATLCQI